MYFSTIKYEICRNMSVANIIYLNLATRLENDSVTNSTLCDWFLWSVTVQSIPIAATPSKMSSYDISFSEDDFDFVSLPLIHYGPSTSSSAGAVADDFSLTSTSQGARKISKLSLDYRTYKTPKNERPVLLT